MHTRKEFVILYSQPCEGLCCCQNIEEISEGEGFWGGAKENPRAYEIIA